MIRTTILALFAIFLVDHDYSVVVRHSFYQQLRPPTLSGCEGNNSDLSGAHHMAGPDGTIIAIARLGDGEQNSELNRRRLHNVRIFLTEVGWHRDPTTVITAQGERVKGYGRVELYVRGIPLLSLAVKHNKDLMVGSCLGPDRNLYPYLDKRSRRTSRKH